MRRPKLIFYFMFLLSSALMAGDRPAVIAIGRVYGYGNLAPTLIHNQIISDLVTEYECSVLTRSKLYNVSVEDAIKRLSLIKLQDHSNKPIPAADYVMSLRLRHNEDKTWKGVIRGTALMQSRGRNQIEAEFTAPSMLDVPKEASRVIANELNLERRGSEAKKTTLANSTWLVMPVVIHKRFGKYDEWKYENKDELVQAAELALQESRSGTKILDHSDIDSILVEHKLSALKNVNYVQMGSIARLMDADIMLYSSVVKRDADFRLDLHLVNAETANVFDALVGSCKTEDSLKALIKGKVSELARRNHLSQRIEPSTKKQRVLEAEFYLNIYDFLSGYGADFVYYSSDDRALAVQENLEAAYLLTRDDPMMVYRTAELLSDLLELHNYRWKGKLSKRVTQRAAYVLEKILEPITNEQLVMCRGTYHRRSRFGEGFVPMLLRAEALMFQSKHSDALKLASKHHDVYPKLQPARALWVMAKCHIAMTQVDKARDLCEQIAANYEHDNDYRELVHSIAKHSNDKTAIYKAVRAKIQAHEKVKSIKEWNTYLDILVEQEDPKEALKELRHWCATGWRRVEYPTIGRFGAWLAEAKCYLKLNDRKSAARRCKDIIAMTLKSKNGTEKQYRKQAAEILSQIEKDIAPVAELWKTGADVKPGLSKYRIYYAPIDGFHLAADNESLRILSRFFGMDVAILPATPIQDKLAGIPKRDDFFLNNEAYFKRVIENLHVPDDAVFLVLTSHQDGLRHWPISCNEGNPLLFVHSRPHNKRYRSHINKHATRCAILGACYTFWPKRNKYNFPLDIEECANRPCIMSERLNSSYVNDVRDAFCPQCQDIYKNVNFDKMHNDLMSYLKKSGAKIVNPSEVEFTVVEPEKGAKK